MPTRWSIWPQCPGSRAAVGTVPGGCRSRSGRSLGLWVLFPCLVLMCRDGLWAVPSENVVGHRPADGAALRSAAYYHFVAGRLSLLAEDLPQALQEFQAALEADPESVTLRLEVAWVLYQSGEVTKAVEACREAISRDPTNTEGHLLLGKIFYGTRARSDEHAEAVEAFEKVLELEPKHTEALQSLAELYFQAGDFEASARSFRRLREMDPSVLGYYFSEAQALAESGNLEEAAAVLQQGLKIRSDVPEYLLFLGNVLERLGKPEEAVAVYRDGLANGPEPRLHRALAAALVQVGEGREAIPLLERLEDVFPQDESLRLDLARAYRQARRLDESRRILSALVETQPENLEAAFELATLLAEMGEREQAAQRFQQLVDLERADAKAFRPLFLTNLSLIRLEQHRFDEGVRLAEEALRFEPANRELRRRLMQAYRAAGRLQPALDLGRELWQETPDDPQAAATYAQVLAATGRLEEAVSLLEALRSGEMKETSQQEFLCLILSQLFLEAGRYDEAEEVIEDGLTTVPGSRRLHFQLGAVLERRQDFEEAERVFRTLLENDPDAHDVLNYLGYMLADRGVRLDEAVGYLERAVSLDPYNGAYQDSLGWAYFQQSELEKAEQHLLSAARLELNDPVILEHLGDLYSRKGDGLKAEHFYREALKFQDKGSEAARIREKLAGLSAPEKR